MLWQGMFKRLGTCLGLFFGMHVHANTPAQALVEKMAFSAKNLSYKGYFIYERGQQNSSYQIIHKVDNGVEKQRLVFLDGAPYEVINNGHSLTCLQANNADSHELQAVIPEIVVNVNPGSLWDNYSASITGETRVANRLATKVELNPKDQHRYPVVFFVDNETGLMLKMRVLNTHGQLLEQFHYAMIDYLNVTDEDLLPKIKGYVEVEHSMSDTGSKPPVPVWQAKWIPAGFQKEINSGHGWRESVQTPEAVMYSDGLSVFSVFVEPVAEAAADDTSVQIGSTSVISHYLAMHGKVFLVTVIGEIPLMTAKQIALSVEFPP